MAVVYPALLRALLLSMMAGSVAGLLIGAALIVRPEWVVRMSRYANRWISTRGLERVLDKSFKVDRFFYRHSRTVGAVMLAGAVYIIYFFTAGINKSGVAIGLSRRFAAPPALMETVLNAVSYSCLAGSAFALIISLFLLVRPSKLRGFEQGANQWLSSRRGLKPLEIPRSGVDEYVLHRSQRTGVLLLVGSLYVLVMLTIWAR